MKKILILLLLPLLLSACDAYYNLTSNITGDSIYVLTHNYLGMNVKQCAIPADEPQPETPNTASPNYVPSQYACFDSGPKEICGYDCKVAGGRIKCGYLPAQHCIVGSSNYIACGYDCKRTSREANCGIRYGDTCVIARSQQVICGLNCRDIDGLIRCEPSLPFRAYFPQSTWP